MFIVLIGAPGAGKGTQGRFLSNELSIPHVSVGDIFRSIVKSDTDDGKILNSYIGFGKLVPSDLVNKIVNNYLKDNKYLNSCILDGYPRSLQQAEFLDTIVNDIVVIFFKISENEAIKRLLGRFSCAKCGMLYNKNNMMPKIDEICDVCGGSSFIYRTDDEESIIKKRMEEYLRETSPIIEYYNQKGCLNIINVEQKQDEISLNLLNLLKKV